MPKTDGYITKYGIEDWKYSNIVNPDVGSISPTDEAYWRVEQPKTPGTKCDVDGRVSQGAVVDFTNENGLLSANPEDRSGIYIQWAGVSPMELDVLLIVWSVPIVLLNSGGFNTNPLAVRNVSLTGRLMSIKLSGPVAIDGSKTVKLSIKKDSVGWYGDKQKSRSEYDPTNNIKADFDNYIRRNNDLKPDKHDKVLYLNNEFNDLECKCTHPFNLEQVTGCNGKPAKIWQVSYELFGSTLPTQVYPLNELKDTTLNLTYYGTTLDDLNLCSACQDIQVEIMAIRGPRVTITAQAPNTGRFLPRKSVVTVNCGCDEFTIDPETEVPEVEEVIGKHYDRILPVIHFTTTELMTATASIPNFASETVYLPLGTNVTVNSITSATTFGVTGGVASTAYQPDLHGDKIGLVDSTKLSFDKKGYKKAGALSPAAGGTSGELKLLEASSGGTIKLAKLAADTTGKLVKTWSTDDFATTGTSMNCYTTVNPINNVAIAGGSAQEVATGKDPQTDVAKGNDPKNVVTSHSQTYLTGLSLSGYTATPITVCDSGGSPTTIYVLTVATDGGTISVNTTSSTLPSVSMTGVTGKIDNFTGITSTVPNVYLPDGRRTINEPTGVTPFLPAIYKGKAITNITTEAVTEYPVAEKEINNADFISAEVASSDGIEFIVPPTGPAGSHGDAARYVDGMKWVNPGGGTYGMVKPDPIQVPFLDQLVSGQLMITLHTNPVEVFKITDSTSKDVLVGTGEPSEISYVVDPGYQWKMIRETDPNSGSPYKLIGRDSEVKKITTVTINNDCTAPTVNVTDFEPTNQSNIVLSTPVLVSGEAPINNSPGRDVAENDIKDPGADPLSASLGGIVASVNVTRLKRPYPS